METKIYSNLFQKIMLCTDNSAEARVAELFAINLASTYKSELLVLHVYDMPPAPKEKGIFVDEFELSMQRMQQTKLSQRLEGLDINFSLSFLVRTKSGRIADIVSDEAKKNSTSLLIVGAHGSSGFLSNSFGSNTLAIINASSIPVLVVASYASFKSFNRILVASKWLAKETSQLKQFLPWLKAIKAILNFIHVYEGEHGSMLGAEEANQHLQAQLPGISATLTNVKSTDVAAALEEHTRKEDLDCLMLFAEDKKLFDRLFAPNIIKRMLYQLEIPILYIPKN